MSKLQAYKEILSVLNKHQELLKEDHQIDITSRVRARIALQEIQAEFGIKIKPDTNPNWCKLSEHANIGLYGSIHNRTISWSDDGSQPNGERLYSIAFPTGAYVFGGEYPTKTFGAFFEELKSYRPKYIDTNNHCLYFTSETAKYIHDDFGGIYLKYRGMVNDELKAKEIIALEAKLAKLQET